jgi:hypothetical protein
MAVEGLVFVALAAVGAYLLVARTPGVAESILTARKVIFGVGGLVTALFLIATGVLYLQLLGAGGLFLGFLFVFVERPDETLWRYVP